MAKIILAIESAMLRAVPLVKKRVTIGRGPQNDIVIDDRAISAEHAVIVTSESDSFLEDLNSTNGTQVNGQPVKKHFLRDGDVVLLAGYQIRFVETDRISALEDNEEPSNNGEPSQFPNRSGIAIIKVLNGSNPGREIVLGKALTTVGLLNVQVVAIARGVEGYYLAQIEGNSYTLVNGKPTEGKPVSLTNGDLIALGGVFVRFSLI